MPLYEYAILLKPTVEEAKNGKIEELILGPKALVAKDQRTADLMVAREIPDSYVDKLDRVEVAVRPF